MCLMFGTLKSQTIDELLQSGNIAELEQAEAKINGDLQSQITYNRELINSLISEISELRKLVKKEVVIKDSEVESTESKDLIKFKRYLSKGKDYLYIYKQFNTTQLKAIAKLVGLEPTGYKKDITKSIINKIN